MNRADAPSGTFLIERLSGNAAVRFPVFLRRAGDYIGGLVTEWLGHVPEAGESLERDGLSIKVLAANQVRVDQVRVAKAAARE